MTVPNSGIDGAYRLNSTCKAQIDLTQLTHRVTICDFFTPYLWQLFS